MKRDQISIKYYRVMGGLSTKDYRRHKESCFTMMAKSRAGLPLWFDGINAKPDYLPIRRLSLMLCLMLLWQGSIYY